MASQADPTMPLDFSSGDFEEDFSGSEPKSWASLIPLQNNAPAYTNVIELTEDEHTFGRAPSCSICFKELGISGKHCRIFKEPNPTGKSDYIIKLEDTSTNGTHINGAKICKMNMLLSNGDTVTFLHTPQIAFIFKLNDRHQEPQDGPYKSYQIGQLLGTGQFASVHLCIHKETGQQWAIKIIDKKKFSISSSSDRPDALLGEVEILKKLKHPGCIGINETFETPEKLYLILELATGGELFDKIVQAKKFDEPRARKYFLQMCEAIKYLHDQGIVHRDLKPENILLKSKSEDQIKLSDFGLSRIVGDGGTSTLKTMCGTPQYVAPEVLTHGGGASAQGYNKACDLWSLGVILFVLLAGYPPFYEEGRSEPLFDQIKKAHFDFPNRAWKTISPEAKDLIVQLLIVDTDLRITVDGCLEHPWIKGTKLADDYTAALLKAIDEKNAGKKDAIYPFWQTPTSSAKRSAKASSASNQNGKASAAKKAAKVEPEPEDPEEEEEEEAEVEVPVKKTAAKATRAKAAAAAPKKAAAKRTAGAKKSRAASALEKEEEEHVEEAPKNTKKRKAASETEEAVPSPPKRAKR